MISGKRVIAVVPARGGSKSVPGKNIRPLAGKPLIGWSIEVAQRVEEIDRVIVSTDDAQIAEAARRFGAEIYRRPDHLATDDALVIDALRDLHETLRREGERADIMVLLEPTCPLRSSEDVRQCVVRMVEDRLDSVATFKPADLNPHRAWQLEGGAPRPFIDHANPWKPRQELPTAYQLNGAVYAFYPGGLPGDINGLLFGRSGAVIMPHERSVDIDVEFDFILTELILERMKLPSGGQLDSQ
ncbi:acylneuraminate cytidylyltransferase family protein [Halomonas sp. TRM85114]|uniref:acylneuraminate cytidylyltransferase family protein n=1 Tax=Halomonas jincaotanensis TaxID=2810616 RepID=UPI001BD46005|nr:acylneuraminate cytidylyltransferase family protein [Halomonas jincaotanensis]MBS9404036.1 acylneuraminate cytidylyltransferase family protein [Halomonas jincaotanensis]